VAAVVATTHLIVLAIVVFVAPAVIAILKGRWEYIFLALLLTPVVPWVAALRLARPDSFWARHFYGWYKMERSRHRFPDDGSPVDLKERLARRPLLDRIFDIDREGSDA
jgi:hypothetical protein